MLTKRKNVLFLMFAFPDLNKSYNMYTTLVEEFVQKGHDVTVIAPGDLKTNIYTENGIKILRARTLPIKNVPNFLKGISNLLIPLQFELALNKFYKGKSFDVIISTTPPITLADLAAKIKKRFGSKFYLILRDIFPQNAIDLGFIKENSLLHNYFRSKEKKLYEVADYIGCMSSGNIEYIIQHNPEIEKNKLHELKNFQKQFSAFVSDPTSLKIRYGINDKFVVVFGGNMGKPQQLENVLTLAESVQQYPKIIFLLLGEGVQMNKIELAAKKKGIKNIKIQRTIPKHEYQALLSVCDIGLISLHEKFTIPNIPSKALDYFNVGIPVLASLDKATDFGTILDNENCGLWSFAGDHFSFTSNLLKLYNDIDLKFSLGKNGKRYFVSNLLPETAYSIIMNKID